MSKKKEKYITHTDWMTFKQISEIMTAEGDNMSLVSTRNYLYKGLEKIAENILIEYYDFSAREAKKNAYRVAREESFQETIVDALREIHISNRP